jgi:hypothetical protein
MAKSLYLWKCTQFFRSIVIFFISPVYVLYVLYVTNRGQSKVVGALRAPTNNIRLPSILELLLLLFVPLPTMTTRWP